ncbi:LPXTG cell wall anchor domain-containing protein, partial [Staphylococcus hominis]
SDADADSDAGADNDAGSENKQHDKEQLPDTGNKEQTNGTLLGSLFAAAGSLFFASKRRKNKKENK